MTIQGAIFAVETIAHLQGKERDLLPIAEAARAEHEALLECVTALRLLLNGCDTGERNADGSQRGCRMPDKALCDQARGALEKFSRLL